MQLDQPTAVFIVVNKISVFWGVIENNIIIIMVYID